MENIFETLAEITRPEIKNTYAKYCPNVWVAKCPEKHEKGEVIPVTTQYGKDNECIVFNCVGQKMALLLLNCSGGWLQCTGRAKAKAERYSQWAASAEKKSTQYYEASNEGRDF